MRTPDTWHDLKVELRAVDDDLAVWTKLRSVNPVLRFRHRTVGNLTARACIESF